MEERMLCTHEDVGSSPTVSTPLSGNQKESPRSSGAERSLGKGEVSGSNPVAGCPEKKKMSPMKRIPPLYAAPWTLQVSLRGTPGRSLERARLQVLHCAQACGLDTPQHISLAKQRRIWTLLRSPHVHKKARDQWALHRGREECRWTSTNPQPLAVLWQGLRQMEWVDVEVHCTLHHATQLPRV